MDLVVATSRGKNLSQYFHHHQFPIPIIIEHRRGATIESLIGVALAKLSTQPPSQIPHHVYFLAGLPDITQFHRSHDNSYQEVIHSGTPRAAADQVMRSIDLAVQTVKNYGAVPCFCTVCPMSFKAWNEARLGQGKTTHLQMQHLYTTMQHSHESATAIVNQYIYDTNTRNNMHTPKTAEQIFRQASANRRPRVLYGRFQDGVHPDPLVEPCWAEEILNASIQNHHMYTLTV